MAIVKVWLDDPDDNDVGVFEIREELEHPFCLNVENVEYKLDLPNIEQVSED
jgi:hypothetical protein